MNTKYLRFTHEKCKGNVIPAFVGISEDYNLIVDGYCTICGEMVRNKVSFEKLIADCPGSKPIKPPLKDRGDDQFLKDCGIDPQ